MKYRIFDTEAEALEIANGVAYGLTGYVWTNDLTRAQIYFDTAEQGLSSIVQSRLFDTPAMRRMVARFGASRTETLSAARVANEIARAGKTIGKIGKPCACLRRKAAIPARKAQISTHAHKIARGQIGKSRDPTGMGLRYSGL